MLKDQIANRELLTTNQLVADYFRCPDGFVNYETTGEMSPESGYFKFGSQTVCFGQCSSGSPSNVATGTLHDAESHVCSDRSSVLLPFAPNQVVDNLRYERYCSKSDQRTNTMVPESLARKLYYLIRPLMLGKTRVHVQRRYFRGFEKIPFPRWPVDFGVDNLMHQLLAHSIKAGKGRQVPFIWFWPEGASSCALITHDVETVAGRDFCTELMDLNDSYGIKSAFQIIPEKRYPVSQSFLDSIWNRGFEVNVHDLCHDGHLLDDREEFLRRADRINAYGRSFKAHGFRSGMLYRNLDWYDDALDFSYDMSVPNLGHLEAQRGGCCTVFPFFNGRLLEIPVTMTQDYVLFNMLKDYTIDLWKQQMEMIMQMHGIMSLIVHPDYIIEMRERAVYTKLLAHLKHMEEQEHVWITTPSEVNEWWRQRAEMRLCPDGDSWRIEGCGKERALLAYAHEENGRLMFSFESLAD